ncbi:MAG: MFS transporter [Paracoccaceae bacterium]
MRNRWIALGALTAARLAMGVAFQSIAALAPDLMARSGMGWAEIGSLMGAFMLPGIAAALAGGWLGARFGEGRVAVAGLLTMAVSGAAIAALAEFEALFAARLVLGAGGVALNVMLTKMVADRFAAEDLPVAMGVFVSSWPVGLALALLALPPAAAAFGPGAALAGVAALALAAAGLVAAVAPPRAGGPPPPRARLTRAELAGVLLAGSVWGLYNVPLILFLGFGPALFAARGWAEAEAGPAVSVFGWVTIVSVVLGGWVARALGGRGRCLALCLAGWTAATLALAFDLPGATTPLFLGLVAAVAGIGAGSIMAMPAVATRPESRSVGMGVFYAVYYAFMTVGPPLAGWMVDATGDPAAPFALSAALLVATALAALAFERGLAPPASAVRRS